MSAPMGINLPLRIIIERQWLLRKPAPGISASPSEENLRHFHVRILGPAQSPCEGGVFKLELFLPEDYPFKAPKIRTVLQSIQALMRSPNPDDPLAESLAKHWKTDEAHAVATATKWTRLYAM